MPSKEAKNSDDLALSRRIGKDQGVSIVRAAGGTKFASGLSGLILKNIHTSVVSKKGDDSGSKSIGNSSVVEQREGAEPVMKLVRVGVKRFTATGQRNNEWDESINWEPNSKKWEGGLASQGQQSNAIKQPFVMIEVPYEKWRKHYAKDKNGRYRGTEEPAENCILLPEDELKFRSELPAQDDDASRRIEQVEHASTLPEYKEVDSGLQTQREQEQAPTTQKEEAIFIESDGHTASKIVNPSKAGLSLPTSPTSPVSQSYSTSPTSPTSPASKKSWRDRVEKTTRFAILGRSDPDKVIR